MLCSAAGSRGQRTFKGAIHVAVASGVLVTGCLTTLAMIGLHSVKLLRAVIVAAGACSMMVDLKASTLHGRSLDDEVTLGAINTTRIRC